jgi:hypothetical protein
MTAMTSLLALEMPESRWPPWMVEGRFVEAADVMAAQ